MGGLHNFKFCKQLAIVSRNLFVKLKKKGFDARYTHNMRTYLKDTVWHTFRQDSQFEL